MQRLQFGFRLRRLHVLPPAPGQRQRARVQQAGLVAVDAMPETRPPPRVGPFDQVRP